MNLLPRQSPRKPFALRETHVPIAPLAAIIFTTLLLGGYLSAPARAETTLLAYYPFEEGTGYTTQDKTERNGSARLMGDAAFTAGKYGAGLEFTGFGDWVDTGRNILDTTHSFSVACWICLADGFDADFRTAISQDAERVSGFYLQYNKPKAGCAPDRLSFIRWNHEKAERGVCAHSADHPRASEWVHLAGVADMEHHRLQLYVNGILAQEQVYDAADRQFEFPSSGHTILGRGRFNGQPGDLFAGKIDEVYLFQGALIGREVARIRDDEYLVHKPQRTQTGDQPPLAQFSIDLAKTGGVISPLLFGQNLEHTRYGVWHGLSAQLIANHKFAGPPHVDGLAADWLPIGAPQARFQIDHAKSYAGGQAQQITLSQASRTAGLAQGSLPLLQGRIYQVRLALRSEKPHQITVRFYDQNGDNGFESRTFSIEPDDWRELAFTFTSPRTDPQTRLELTFESPGALQVGMISLLPEDHFHTLRRDVVDLFKAFHPSLLRWPGGNFVRDYVWQEGLLPHDRRPPILSTWRSTLPFTHSYDPHDIGTDEFIELCRYLGAEPCITINMDPKTAPPSEAAAWVEYCNGDVNTHWGKVRAERGHEESYDVKYWFVGNEVWGHWMGPTHTDVITYSQRVAAYADAMKKADPSIMLIASGQGAIAGDEGAQWDDALLTRARTHFDLLSQHHYAPAVSWGAGPESDRPFSIRMHEAVEGLLPPNPEVEPEFARLSRYGESEMVPLLRNVRQAIDRRAPDRHMGIVLDEWNVWRNWFTRPYESGWHDGVTEAIYAAGMFHMFIREAEPLGITMALFFQVVNEGGMMVDPYSAKLTPLGQVFTMFTVHQGGRLVQINQPRPGMGLDLCASISRDARSLNITLVNRNPWREQDAELLLGASLAGAAVPLKLLSTPRLTPYAIFEQRTETLNISQDGHLRIHLPRYAVGLMRIALSPVHAP